MSRINVNVPSLVAARILNKNNDLVSNSLQRLSTGLRINSGQDDPAGLIASERLRAETTAISAAIDNANKADKVVSVAEGGLQEINSLLVQLEGLVDKSANEAGISTEEVAANQLQVDTILDSINRLATSTEFSGKKLLNGTLDYTTSLPASGITDIHVTGCRLAPSATKAVVLQVTTSAQTASLKYTALRTPAGTTTIQVNGKYGSEQFTFAGSTLIANVVTAINAAKNLTGVSCNASGAAAMYFRSTDFGADAFVSVDSIAGTAWTLTGGSSATKDYGQDPVVTVNGMAANTDGLNVSYRTAGLSFDATLSQWFATQTGAAVNRRFDVTGGGADFAIAPTLGLNAMASLGIQNVSTATLGTKAQGYLSTLASGGTNQLSSTNPETAQRIVRTAINQVSSLRGRLGAFQKNTLASSINSLQVTLENVTAAESAIRDTDFAAETSNLTRAQILASAATSALQVANAQPQNVLSLLGR